MIRSSYFCKNIRRKKKLERCFKTLMTKFKITTVKAGNFGQSDPLLETVFKEYLPPKDKYLKKSKNHL